MIVGGPGASPGLSNGSAERRFGILALAQNRRGSRGLARPFSSPTYGNVEKKEKKKWRTDVQRSRSLRKDCWRQSGLACFALILWFRGQKQELPI